MYKYSKKFLSMAIALTLVGTNFMPSITYAANEISKDNVTSSETTQENSLNNVNQENNTQEVSSNIDNEQVQWEQDVHVTIKQELKRYLKYENKTLVSFLISSGIKDNAIPLIEKTVQVYVPKIQDKEPSKIIVSGKDYIYQDQILVINSKYNENSANTQNTENDANNIGNENTLNDEQNSNDTQNSNNTQVQSQEQNTNSSENSAQSSSNTENTTNTENTSNAESSGNTNTDTQSSSNAQNSNNDTKDLEWNSNDEVLVTFIYESQMDDTTLNSIAIVSAKTIDDKVIQEKTEETSYNVSEQVGSLLETSIDGDKEVSKGYLYTNLYKTENKYETKFYTNYQVNVGFKDLVDEIQVRESNLTETGANNQTASENSKALIKDDAVLTRKVSVKKEELINLLGEEGTIRVLDSQNQEIGVLKQDNLELNIESYGLKFITSKPTSEGYINIKLEKVLNVNTEYNLELVKNKNGIDNSIDVVGILQGNEISNNHIDNKIALIEPVSNAKISINKDALSTVVTNENVVITATLERNDITDALYKDPELLITLPSQITGVNLKDARLIYEDELVPVDFRTFDNKIYLRLQGVQTKYSPLTNVNGTVVKIVADLTLNNLAVNSDEKITLQYTNRVKDEIKSVEAPIKIVAPAGFVTSNNGTVAEPTKGVSSQTVTCIGSDEVLSIKANDKEKTSSFGGIAISNLKENAKGLAILGRFPTQDAKSVDGKNTDLGSTYSINVTTPVSVEGLDADIYYSDNGGATYDLANEQNGWSMEKKDTSKSFLIVAKSEVTPAQRITFSYNGIIPQNLDYENKTNSIFGIYYNNETTEGVAKNVVSSKLLSIETENIPVVKTEIIASDYKVGDEIKNGDKINNGKYIKYVVRATNTGRKAAENVTLTVTKPENSEFYHIEKVENEDYYDNYFSYEETMTSTIDKIEPGQTVEETYIVRVYSYEEKAITFRSQLTAENMREDSTASFENTVTDGLFEMEINTNLSNSNVKIGDEVTYNLTLENIGSNEFKNVNVNIDIPKYIDLVKYDGASYDSNKRVLSYNIDNLESYKRFEFTTKVVSSDEPSQEISLVAKAKYEGGEKEIKSNTYTSIVQDLKGFSASVSSNIPYKMLDTDTVEYYVNVKNESKKTAEVNIFNRLPKELELVSYTVKNGENTYTEEDSLNTEVTENVEPYENLKVTIVAKPYYLDRIGQIEEIENEIQLSINDIDVELEKIKQQIEGSSNYTTVVGDEDENIVETENIYSISGKIWYDENGNSAQDENERMMSGILLKLYDVNKKEFVKDEEGKDIQVIANDNGEYRFEKLYKGEYIVIADYDNEVYEIANYQTGEIAQNENSDFIENTNEENNSAEQNQKFGTAVTNIITIGEENVYNIDLGLRDADNFNITINNKISKITVIDGTKSETYDYNNYIANLQVNNEKLKNATLIIEYEIEVRNDGNIDGYITQVVDKIQDGMEFASELNQDWYVNGNNEAVNSSLSNKIIKSGESEILKLTLIKNKDNEDGQVITNTSEIKGTFNQYGIEEVTTTELKQNNAKSAQLYISASSKSNALEVVAISVSIILAISLIAFYANKILEKKINI